MVVVLNTYLNRFCFIQSIQNLCLKEHAFDAFAVPEPVDDDGVYEDGVADNDYDDEVSDFSERAHGHAGQFFLQFSES